MDDKYAIEVAVPALGKTFEFMVPPVMEMASVKKLILEMISGQYMIRAEGYDNLWLIDLKSQKLVPDKSSCREAGVRDGSKLMLVNIS